MSPPKAAKIDDLSHTIQAWENLEQRHRERTGDQLPKDMRLAILLSMCPTDLERELTAQQHLFPDYAQMRAHIVTVINSRTCDPAPMMMPNSKQEASNHYTSSNELVEGEDGELNRFEVGSGTKVFTKSRHEPSKEEGRVKLTENVSAVDALVTFEQIAERTATAAAATQTMNYIPAPAAATYSAAAMSTSALIQYVAPAPVLADFLQPPVQSSQPL